MYNKVKKQQDKLDKARDEKCVPLAKAYLQAILNANVSLNGDLPADKLQKEYEPVVLELLGRYLEANLTIIEIGYVRKLVQEMIDNTENLLVSSVNSTLKVAETRLWGIDKEDLTLQKIDQVIEDTNPKETS